MSGNGALSDQKPLSAFGNSCSNGETAWADMPSYPTKVDY